MKNLQLMLTGREVSKAENKKGLSQTISQGQKGLSQATPLTPDKVSGTARLWFDYGSSMARVWKYAAMLLMVLTLGAGEMWGAITLRYQKDMPAGNYDGNTSVTMTQSSANSNRYYCTVSLSASSPYGFFIIDGSNYYKANVTAYDDRSVSISDYGSSNYGNSNHRVTYTSSSAGTYVFTYDRSNHKICVSPQSVTVKMAWSTASGHDSDWDLGTYTQLSQVGSTANYTIDLDLTAVKHYMFVQFTHGNTYPYWRGSSALSINGSTSLYFYGTDNYGGSGDKINFTPSTAAKYRFTWNQLDKTMKLQRLYNISYQKGTYGTGSTQTDYKVHGTAITLRSSGDFSRTGYTQTAWNTNSAGTGGTSYALNGTYSTEAALTLYPTWTVNNYNISYDPAVASHCTYTTTPVNADYGTTVNLTITPDANYVVSSVTTSPSVTVTDNGDNTYSFTMPASDVTVSVVTALASVTVNYGAGDNGSLAAKQGGVSIGSSGSTVDGGSTVNFTATPNTGYEVEGWYSSYSAGVFSGKIDAAGTSTTYNPVATSTLNVYVKFKLSTYTITYNLNSGTNHEDNPATYQYPDETITLQDPTREGYYFAGWYTSSTFTGGTEKTTIPNHSTGNVTLYAKWIGFSGLTIKPSTLHTGPKNDTIVVGDALTITPTLSNAPVPSIVCPKALYMKSEGQWVEQEVTISSNGAGGFTITGTPLAGSKPLPAGEYKVALTLRNGSTCAADEIIKIEKIFYIGEQSWHIYGGSFWAWTPWASVPSITDTNGDGIQLRFLPTAITGQYYFGPFKFKNEGGKDYTHFRLYNKINARDVFASSGGDFTLNSTFNENKKVTLTYSSSQYANSFDASSLTDKDYYLYVQDGKMWVSSTRPVLAPKVRMKITGGGKNYWTNEVTLSDGNPRKISFYHPGGTVTLTTERFLLGIGWTSVAKNVALTLDNVTRITTAITSENKGVYVADLTWDASNDHVDISNVEKYTGDYWIRTNHSPGGWDGYKVNGNLFTYSAYDEEKEDYTHYFMKWVEGSNDDGRNVKFEVANEYNSQLSKDKAGFAEDDYANGYGNLKQNANVRFMYNSNTNALSRAYLSGSARPQDYFLVLKGDHTAGYHLYSAWTSPESKTEHTTNENTDWAFFSDNKNWVYQVTVYATPGTRIKLTAQFTNKSGSTATQYFKGKAGDFNTTNTEALLGGSGTTAYLMTVVYDFKTNRLMSAWKPNGDIEGTITDVDVMLERYKDGAATAITFREGGSLTAKNVIGSIRFAYNDLKNKVGTWNETTRPLLTYFISFPFDVNVSDVFGLNSVYGDAYVIRKYDGAERAKKGFFRGDGTTSFWKDMDPSEKMEKNVGYCLILDNDYFNGNVGHIWDDKIAGTSVYLYFPSTGAVGSISGDEETITVPSHECKIDRTFTGEGGTEVNHQNTDSHWNLMGVPVFGNTSGTDEGTPGAVFLDDYDENNPFKYYYEWQPSDNSYIIGDAAATTFKAMHSYLVQYYGDVTFTGSAPAALVAARRVSPVENYNIELQVLNSEQKMLNRTFVELREEACDTFALNEDVYMSYNKRAANIFTFAGNYDVAANVLSIGNHTIPVGIEIRTAGTYSISMPSAFSGTAILLDKETGVRTNLAVSDYEIELPKGVYSDRFELEISDISTVITDIEYTTGEGSLKDGKPHKFLQNGLLYLLKDGVIYDAQGHRVK